mgnify:CR=1 FL=1
MSVKELKKDLEKLLKIESAGGRADEVKEIVKYMYDKFKYIPLAPYYDVQRKLRLIVSKKDPLEFIKQVCVTILSHSYDDSYYNELGRDVVVKLRLIRWAIHVASQGFLGLTAKDLYIAAKAVMRYVEGDPLKAKKELQNGIGSKEKFRKILFKEPATMVDILINLNFLKAVPKSMVCDLYYGVSKRITGTKFIPKLYMPTIQSSLLIPLYTIRGRPLKNIDEDYAKFAVETGVSMRKLVIEKLQSYKTPIEVYDSAYSELRRKVYVLVKEDDIADYILKYTSTILYQDIIATIYYLAYYRIRPMELEELAKFLALHQLP